jgi:flagellar basal body-associated protein FliL
MDDRKKQILIHWLLAVFLAVAVFCLVFFWRSRFDFAGVSDACFFAFCLLFAGPLLMLIHRFGVFDVFEYSFVTFVDSFRRGSPKRYADAYSYQQTKKEERQKRKPFVLPYFAVGTVMFSLAIAFLIAFFQN